MKKLIFILIFFTFVDQGFSQFKFGPKIGVFGYKVVYHTKAFRSQFKTSYKPGFLAGASFELPITDALALRMDPAYTMRGRKVFVKENGWTLDEFHHLVEMPIQLLVLRPGGIKQIGPFSQIGPLDIYFGIGPNISYFLGGFGVLKTQALKHPYKISFSGHESDVNYVTFSDANRFMWGLDISVGVIGTLGNKNEIATDLKFNYGHSDIGKFDGSDAPILGFVDNLASAYRMLTLSVTYWYGADLKNLKKGKTSGDEIFGDKKVTPPPKKKSKKKNINRFKSNKPVKNSSKHPKNINKIRY